MRQISSAILAAACWAALVQTSIAAEASHLSQNKYHIIVLGSLGGTSSRGNSVNDWGLVAGFSNLTNGSRHATLWYQQQTLDLGTLGTLAGLNSTVPWPVKNVLGLVSGISQTDTPDPNHETWSCGAFLANPTGNTCRGFVWDGVTRKMRALPVLPGGNNGFATGTNNWGQTVGWAENGVHDTACAADSDQVLQFKPVIYGPDANQIRALPLVGSDQSGAATAVNDSGQVVGISGDCDQAAGRKTARNAVLWDRDGTITKLGSIGSDVWNTPMAISERGDVVGFVGIPGTDPNAALTHAFFWARQTGLQDLGTLQVPNASDSAQANGVNERRQVVGYSCNAAGSNCLAFLWQNGAMANLNDLIEPGSDFTGTLNLAQDINDEGVITGRASDAAGTRVAFVAIPAGR